MAKIKIKNSVTPGSAPAGLSLGEMAVNIADRKIFIGNAVESVVTLHDQNNIVTSVNGQTGAVTISVSSTDGVTGLIAGSGISVSGQTGNVTITNVGLLTFNGSTGDIQGISSISGYTGIVSVIGGRGITYGFGATGKTLYYDLNYAAPGITGLTLATVTTASTSDKVLLQRKPSDKMELITVGNLLNTAYATAPTDITGTISGYRFAFFDGSGNQYSSTVANVQDEILNFAVESLNGQTGHIQLSYVSSFNGQTGDVYGVSSFNGSTGAVIGVSSVNGQTGAVTISVSSTDGVTGIVAGNGISVSGQTGNVTITNVGVLSFNGSTGAIIGVSSINGATGAITNVARLNEGNTFSARQIMNAGISAANLTVNSGVTFNNIDLQSTTATVQGYNTGGYLKMQSFGTIMTIPGNPSIVLQDADTDLGGIPNITINPSPTTLATNTITIGNSNTATTLNGTLSVGSTSTLTGRSTHTAGITSANLYVSGGVTFNSTSLHNGLASFSSGISASNASASNVIDVIAVNDGTGLRIAQADTGGNARVGSVRLGRSATNGSNVLLEGYVGTFRVYNGISGTANNPGTKMLELSTTNAQFGVPIAGATFSSVAGEVSIQKTVLGANDSAYLRIVATDSGSQAYNSDIKGNTAAGVNTVHTLPATTGTLLNSNFNSYVSSFNGTTGAVVFNNYVSSINGATGAVTNINAATVTATATNVNATRYLAFVGGAGDTGIFIDPTTTPLTYNPATGTIGAKKVILTTGSNVVTVDSVGGNVVLTDGTNISTFGLDSFAASYVGPFTISNTLGLTLSSEVIAFEGTGYGYVFPSSNGSSGQALLTNGAGTLSWGTVSSGGGGGSATGFTYASSAPGTPTVGDRWIDSDTGKEYVYVNDGSSSQWIEPVSSNGLSGVTYTSSTNFLEFGVTGSFVKLGVNNTSPQYTLDVNGIINAPVGISAGPITSSGATFSGAVVSDGGYRITSSAINAQTGTTYTLLTSDNGKIITMNNGSAITLTVPAGLPIGYNTTVIQLGAGQVGITASSTTLNSFEGKLNLAGQHAAASIISYTTNVFNVAGGLTA